MQSLNVKARMSRSKRKSSDGVADTTVLFRVPYCKIKMFSFFCVCVIFQCIVYVKSSTNLSVQYLKGGGVSWVPRLTLLDLLTHSQNGTHVYVGDFLYHQPGEKSNKDILCF